VRMARPMQRIRARLDAVSRAETALGHAVQELAPPGARVAWHMNGRHVGVVIRNGYYGRVFVRNERTGREYWIGAYALRDVIAASREGGK